MENDTAHVLPVFSCNTGGKFGKKKLESDKPILDTTLHSYGITNRQELDLLTDNVHDHVYIKITNNNIENQNTVVDSFSNC